ncbi:alpha/beta hydrolase [Pseudomonas denitrificans (nom. rej.)]|nr:alpha/beta hydrolase [Pseudomonas denitrificans (nom. rej.)]
MALAGIALPAWRAQGSDFTFRGHAIRYWSAGSGAPLLLVHGFPTASWDWHYLWQPLAERYRLIACDMLGFGDSAKPKGHDYRILEQADLQQALLDHLGVREPVHLLVHDYGNSVGQELLARHEEGGFALASLVFLNGGLFPETHRAVLSQKLLLGPFGSLIGRLFDRKRLAQNFAKVFGPQTQPSEAELDAFWELIRHNDGPRVMHRLIHYILDRRQHRERWLGAMQRTSVPLRLIDGPEDPISGAHMVVRYRELIPQPDTVELPGIGHYPQVEAPEQVLQHYLTFRQERAS